MVSVLAQTESSPLAAVHLSRHKRPGGLVNPAKAGSVKRGTASGLESARVFEGPASGKDSGTESVFRDRRRRE